MPFHWTDQRPPLDRGGVTVPDMAVQKAVDLIGTGPTVDEAVAEAMDRAAMTLDGIGRFEVVSLSGSVADGRLTYEAHVRVWFVLLERVHG